MTAKALGAAFALAIGLHGCGSSSKDDDKEEKSAMCDFIYMGTPKDDTQAAPSLDAYATALKDLDMDAVKKDMAALLKDSKSCWPADWDNYGPFMLRLAWHAAGSYRHTDKLGGPGGGRMRFEPERSWPDNTNLDKARALLYPLKKKYGDALSWGDLFILGGTTALRESGAPITRMCYGRVDEKDGSKSIKLNDPCTEQGKCQDPWGATTVGLIYVNPEGPMGQPDPVGSAADIRRAFGAMGHSDENTVALIGGGHALGKSHGACNAADFPPGLSPKDAFTEDGKNQIYMGTCGGDGKGLNTVTSGFEGAWTKNPLKWDNDFFKDLLGKTWEKHIGPGGHNQWRVQGGDDANLMRLTSDIALLNDPDYKTIVQRFADDITDFNKVFDIAWNGLTTSVVAAPQWSTEGKCDDGSKPSEELSGQSIPVQRGDDVTTFV